MTIKVIRTQSQDTEMQIRETRTTKVVSTHCYMIQTYQTCKNLKDSAFFRKKKCFFSEKSGIFLSFKVSNSNQKRTQNSCKYKIGKKGGIRLGNISMYNDVPLTPFSRIFILVGRGNHQKIQQIQRTSIINQTRFVLNVKDYGISFANFRLERVGLFIFGA